MVGRGALGKAVEGVGRIGRALGSTVGLAPRRQSTPGTAAGLEYAFDVGHTAAADAVRTTVFDYGPDRLVEREIEDLEAFLAEPPPSDCAVRWVNVYGLHAHVVDRLRVHYGIHTLAAEDVMNVPQRPRMEIYPDHLFLTARMVGLASKGGLFVEQVSMFLFDGLLVTFQEKEGDVFEPIRARLRTAGARLRRRDAGFLVYALLDAIVDHCFPLLEEYAALLDRLEASIMAETEPSDLQAVLTAKKDLGALRRIVWPTRDLVDGLRGNEALSAGTEPFLRDVFTHTVLLADLLETHRDHAGDLVDLYMSVASNRMNEVMKVLTIIATLFIPITFIAGVYGMNFKYIPELEWRYAYATFWGLCAAMVGALLWFFRRRRWL